MPIIPWKPFWDIERWFEEEFPEIFGPWEVKFPKIRTPRMDIFEKDNNIVAEVELPGVDPKDIEVEVKDGYLKIKAQTKKEKEEKREGFYRREIGQSFFKRIVPLPTEVVENKAEAEYENGILRITIPKAPSKKEKVIKIKVKGKEKEK